MTLEPHDRVFFSRLFQWSFLGFVAVTLAISLWTQHENSVVVAERRAHVDAIQAENLAARERMEAMLKELVARQ